MTDEFVWFTLYGPPIVDGIVGCFGCGRGENNTWRVVNGEWLVYWPSVEDDLFWYGPSGCRITVGADLECQPSKQNMSVNRYMNHVAFELTSWNLHNLGDTEIVGTHFCAGKMNARIFVGNIPYDATREDLIQLFTRIGPVVDFKLLLDKETNKSRGFGFCEFSDSIMAERARAAAASGAIQLQGRVLRVDAADVDKSVAHPPHGRSGGGSADSYFMPQALAAGAPYSYPPPGHPVPGQFVALQQQQPAQYVYAADPHSGVQPGATAAPGVVEVNQVIERMETRQIMELLELIYSAVQANPEAARKLLLDNPQLAFGILQMHVCLRLISPNTALGMLAMPQEQQQQQPVAPVAAPAQMRQPFTQQASVPSGDTEPLALDGKSTATQRPPLGNNAAHAPASRVAQHSEQYQATVSQSAMPAPDLDAATNELWKQVAALTPEQLEQLPPEQRQQVFMVLHAMGRIA